MARDVEALRPLAERHHTMLQHHVRRLLVTENDKLVGAVSLEDLLEGDEEAELMRALKQLQGNPPQLAGQGFQLPGKGRSAASQ